MIVSNMILELDNVIAKGEIARRVDALRHVTDLFLANEADYAAGQLDVFDEVFVRLVADIEESARAALAAALAKRAAAPPKIIRRLAADESVAVAAPVLTQSPCLDDKTMIEIIRTRSQEHLLAISRRQTVGAEVAGELLERGDDRVVRSTASNAGAALSEASYRSLVDRAAGDDRLAKAIVARPDVPRHVLSELIAKASDVVRARLEAAAPYLANEIRRSLAEVRAEIASKPVAGARDYSGAKSTVDKLNGLGQLTASRMEEFALAGQVEEAVAGLAALNGMPVELVERAFLQPRKELLLFIAKATELPWRATRALLRLSIGDEISADRLDRYLHIAERLKPETAKQAIRFYMLHGAGRTG